MFRTKKYRDINDEGALRVKNCFLSTTLALFMTLLTALFKKKKINNYYSHLENFCEQIIQNDNVLFAYDILFQNISPAFEMNL